jgi:hypothetical protein
VGVHLPPEIAMKIPAVIEPPVGEWRANEFRDIEPWITELKKVVPSSPSVK